jgi:hypothetical protein
VRRESKIWSKKSFTSLGERENVPEGNILDFSKSVEKNVG